jgi:hypothetical protein
MNLMLRNSTSRAWSNISKKWLATSLVLISGITGVSACDNYKRDTSSPSLEIVEHIKETASAYDATAELYVPENTGADSPAVNLPPKGKPLSNGVKAITDEDIEEISSGFNNKLKISGDLPQGLADLINAAVYRTFGFGIPAEINVLALSESDFISYFGEGVAAYYVWDTETIYLKECQMNLGVISSLAHEVGHGINRILYSNPLGEVMGWWSHMDLLLEMEGMLPGIGLAPFTPIIPMSEDTPDISSVSFPGLDSTLFPFLSLYSFNGTCPTWKFELELQENLDKGNVQIDGNDLGFHANWILLGTFGSFQAVRDKLAVASKEEIISLVMRERTHDEMVRIMDTATSVIFERLEADGNTALKNQFLIFHMDAIRANTLKLAKYRWLACNAYFVQRPMDICMQFVPASVDAGCYAPENE